MTVDWSQFRNKDRVRLVFEGEWRTADESATSIGSFRPDGARPHCWLFLPGWIELAASAELIERPFTPPAAGSLFRDRVNDLYISDGSRYRCVRWQGRAATGSESQWFPWSNSIPSWRATIEVVDGV